MATPELSDVQKAEADEMFAKLEAEAEQVKYDYMSSRVPMALREYFDASHPAPQPPAPPPEPTP